MKPNERVYRCLISHRGEEHAITALEICRELDWKTTRARDVRRIIEKHGNEDWLGVLCAIPGKGYFFAEDLEEIKTYRAYLLQLKKAGAAKLSRFDAAVEHEGFSLKEAA